MQIKVKYVVNQGGKYLVYDDGRQADEGNYVLHPFFGGCGKIVKVYVGYDMSDFDFVAIEGVTGLITRKRLNVVAAKWGALRDDDKQRLDENTVCFVTEENGQLKCHDDGNIMLTYP